MKLLFITERIDETDDDLAFVIQWVEEFRAQGFEVEVLCLKKGVYTKSFPVFSLGKERGMGKLGQLFAFYRHITTHSYDRVFVHLSPFWSALGAPWFVLRRIPVYLWYTHYAMTPSLWITALYAKRLFAATPQSLPQYEGNPKKTIVHHGVPVDFWSPPLDLLEEEGDQYALVSIHRLSRSKRLEIAIRALRWLPKEYTLTVYGRPLDPQYFGELKQLVAMEGLETRVTFKGPVPMPQLRDVYPQYRLMINMAYETIDKTMLEGMLYGIYPITTKGNMQAIGIGEAPDEDTPEAVATFIRDGVWKKYPRAALRDHVIREHSLQALIKQMRGYIEKGI